MVGATVVVVVGAAVVVVAGGAPSHAAASPPAPEPASSAASQLGWDTKAVPEFRNAATSCAPESTTSRSSRPSPSRSTAAGVTLVPTTGKSNAGAATNGDVVPPLWKKLMALPERPTTRSVRPSPSRSAAAGCVLPPMSPTFHDGCAAHAGALALPVLRNVSTSPATFPTAMSRSLSPSMSSNAGAAFEPTSTFGSHAGIAAHDGFWSVPSLRNARTNPPASPTIASLSPSPSRSPSTGNAFEPASGRSRLGAAVHGAPGPVDVYALLVPAATPTYAMSVAPGDGPVCNAPPATGNAARMLRTETAPHRRR